MLQKQNSLVIGLFLATFGVAPSLGQDSVTSKMVLELPAIDNFTFEPKIIEKHCSEVLANRRGQNLDTILLALKHRTLAYLQMGKPQAAKLDIDELCNIKPKEPEFRAYRAIVLLELKQIQEAIQEAREGIGLNPKHAMAHAVLGMALWLDGKKQDGLDSLTKAISLDRKRGYSYYVRGSCFLAQREPLLALQDFNRFLQLSPYEKQGPAVPYVNKGTCLLFLNRPKEALNSFLLAGRLDPKLPNVLEGFARAYGDMGKFHLAAHYAQQLLALRPDAPPGYALSAEYSSRIGKKKEADSAIEKLLNFPPHPVFFWNVGKAKFNMGRYSEALGFFNKGLELSPDHFHCLMGKAHLLATCPDAKFRGGAQALKLAYKAYEDKKVRDWEKWQPAMVVAEAQAESGNFAEQRQALLRQFGSEQRPFRIALRVRSQR